MDDNEDILAVARAAAGRQPLGIEPDGPPAELQLAIAAAVLHGTPVRQVAAVAHMTVLEVVDAAEAAAYHATRRSA